MGVGNMMKVVTAKRGPISVCGDKPSAVQLATAKQMQYNKWCSWQRRVQ
jgi:hypothetical protein